MQQNVHCVWSSSSSAIIFKEESLLVYLWYLNIIFSCYTTHKYDIWQKPLELLKWFQTTLHFFFIYIVFHLLQHHSKYSSPYFLSMFIPVFIEIHGGIMYRALLHSRNRLSITTTHKSNEMTGMQLKKKFFSFILKLKQKPFPWLWILINIS